MDNLKTIIDNTKKEFEKIVNFFQQDLSSLRTGRATPALVENISVDLLGQKFLIKQLASISIIGPRSLSIQPWDESSLSSIEKSITQSSLGISPMVDKNAIIITLPPLTEEYRSGLIKILNDKMESARISIRATREDSWREIQDNFKSGDIREDDKFKGKDLLQEIVNEYNKKVEEIAEKKRKEIMEN